MDQEDIRPFFEQQLAWCGVDYFDFYRMHAQDKNNYQKFKRCRAYATKAEEIRVPKVAVTEIKNELAKNTPKE